METGLNNMDTYDQDSGMLSRGWCVSDMADCLEKQLNLLPESANRIETLPMPQVVQEFELARSTVG